MTMNRFEVEAVNEMNRKHVEARAKLLHKLLHQYECVERAKEELRYLSEYLIKKAGDSKNPPDVHQLCNFTDRIKEKLTEPYPG